MKKITLLILALILTACSAGATTDFDKNLAKWNDANISHYRYQLFIGCFCPFAGDMPLTIEVKDGEIVSMTRFDGTPISETDPSYAFMNPTRQLIASFLSWKLIKQEMQTRSL
jgi:hypothetical protein